MGKYNILHMKIYFMAGMRGQGKYIEVYELIYKYLEELRYQVIDKVVLEKKSSEFYKELEKGGDVAFQNFYTRVMNNIKSADVNVFECSIPSLGLGYQVQKSIDFNKPTIVLYEGENLPHFLAGSQDDRFIMKKYTQDNLKKVLEEALEEAKERSDKRFNFFISPKLLSYLEETSKDEGITKSMFIRNLILEHMKAKKVNIG